MTGTVIPFPGRNTVPAPAGAVPRPADPADPGRPTAARPPALAGQPVSGAAVLDAVAGFIGRFVVFPSEHCLPAVTLWAAHTWAAQTFYVTPRLVLDSAEPGSGKTRVLEALNLLCQDPEMVLSPTTAAIFRMLADRPYTLLFDETDAVFNPRNSGNYEDLRALLNAGYKRGATIPRCVGDAKSMRVQRFPVFAPVALAGIAGGMPATIATRAVTVHMRRRAPGEHAEDWDGEHAETDAAPIRDQLAAWVTATDLNTRPPLPAGVVDRPAEVWRPLVALADAAGGHWPDRARDACHHFVHDTGTAPTSLGIRLLADLRALYTRLGAERLATIDLLKELTALDDAPWGDLNGKPLDARRLARELARYEVHPGPLRLGGEPVKGYRTDGPTGLADAWARYLPAPKQESAVTPDTPVTPQVSDVTEPSRVTDTAVTPGAEQAHVTAATVTPGSPVTPPTSHVTDVTDVTAEPRPTPDADPGPTPQTLHNYGACHGCGRLTNRYGPGGNTHCPTCRTGGPGGAA